MSPKKVVFYRPPKSDRGNDQPRRISRARWLWSLFVILFIYYLTGLPFSFIRPQWIEVKAQVSGSEYGRQSPSWNEDLQPKMTGNLLSWAKNNNIDEATLKGAIKASSLERNPSTGMPSPGTGYRISLFDILGITNIESSTAGATVDPTTSNSTGHCKAWFELLKRPDLGIVTQTTALKKIANSLGLGVFQIYGSCGAGAIGFTQALPSNWWSLMGPGFNPWSREDAAEFTARYLAKHGYFTSGRHAAIHSYNPNSATYTDSVIGRADWYNQDFKNQGLESPKTDVKVEKEKTTTIESSITQQQTTSGKLESLPVSGPRGDWAFGEGTLFQKKHSGEDLLVPEGTAVRAAGQGIVVYADWAPEGWRQWLNKGYGWTIVLYHGLVDGQKLWTLYGHNSELTVSPDMQVKSGEIIARSGNTGASNTPHVHFEVRIGGSSWDTAKPVDPDLWVGGATFLSDKPQNQVAGAEMPLDQEITAKLVKTPAVTTAMKLGDTVETLNQALESTEKLRELAKPLSALETVEKIEKAFRLIEKVKDRLETIHLVLSRWAIGGQQRDLGLNPLLVWQLYSPEGGEREKSVKSGTE